MHLKMGKSDGYIATSIGSERRPTGNILGSEQQKEES